jgi:hypothetical protein
VAARERDDRLIVYVELAAVERLAELHLESQPRHREIVHLAVEDHVAAAAPGLRAEHRDLGVADHVLGTFVAGRGERDADARGDEHGVAGDLHRHRQRLLDAAGDPGDVAGILEVFDQNHELVAAGAADGVLGPDRGTQPVGCLDQ